MLIHFHSHRAHYVVTGGHSFSHLFTILSSCCFCCCCYRCAAAAFAAAAVAAAELLRCLQPSATPANCELNCSSFVLHLIKCCDDCVCFPLSLFLSLAPVSLLVGESRLANCLPACLLFQLGCCSDKNLSLCVCVRERESALSQRACVATGRPKRAQYGDVF